MSGTNETSHALLFALSFCKGVKVHTTSCIPTDICHSQTTFQLNRNSDCIQASLLIKFYYSYLLYVYYPKVTTSHISKIYQIVYFTYLTDVKLFIALLWEHVILRVVFLIYSHFMNLSHLFDICCVSKYVFRWITLSPRVKVVDHTLMA